MQTFAASGDAADFSSSFQVQSRADGFADGSASQTTQGADAQRRQDGFRQHGESTSGQAGEHGKESTNLRHVLLHLLGGKLQSHTTFAALKKLMNLLELAMGE